MGQNIFTIIVNITSWSVHGCG